MNLLKIDRQIEKFKQKIVKCLKLEEVQEGTIIKQKRLCEWIRSQQLKQKKQKEDPKSIFNKEFLMGMVQKIVKIQEPSKEILETDLKTLSHFVRKKMIPKTFSFQSKGVPPEIATLVDELKQIKWSNFYGEVRGPFLKNMFILKKQDFHSNVEQIKVNGLKFLMIEEKVAHRYQRNLVQQVFGRVFRARGSLSMVIKIEVNHDPLEPPYSLFCYIEDRQTIDQDEMSKSLADLKIIQNRLFLAHMESPIQVDQLNVLQIFLSQILVLPVQSLISDFIVRVQKNGGRDEIQIIKCNQQDQKQIMQEAGLREHPSLRNPLLYFSAYIREHSIPISQAQKVSASRELYACFYRCLQMVVKLLLTDFDTSFEDSRINSSICFNAEVFNSLWNVFHRISLLSAWMSEVILPVKKTITIGEIIMHFCPIFNEISTSYTMAENFAAYRDFYHNVEMESYLGSIVSKKSLEKYKDIFLNESQVITTKKFTNSTQIYNQIFQPILREVNLQYIHPLEASFILYFCCKFKYQYQPVLGDIQPKWKESPAWQKCIQGLADKENQGLPFLDIGFDILGYACGINVYSFDKECFERVRNLEQTQVSEIGINWFVDFVRQKYELGSQPILSSLLEKSFKYKKFNTCKKLLEKGIRIRNFKQIIGFHEIINEMDEGSREQLVKTIQQDSPQMHRLFKWQQLMLVNLQRESSETVAIETLDFGTLHIPQEVLRTHIKNGRVVNNLSRKDHKFNSSRQIALVEFRNQSGKDLSFYLESSQYPLMPYFYKQFLRQIGSPEMIPYFTSFFYENKLFHIIQSLKDSLNYHNGLMSFKQDELNSLTDEAHISEAILISMMVLPSVIETRDIIICPSRATRDQIFIVDWRHPYSKDFMYKHMGKVHLDSKNSLFLFQKMTKGIQKKIIAKYSGLEIEKICESVLFGCKQINDRVNVLKSGHFNQSFHCSSSQLLALMFEESFGFHMVERMHKIRRALSKREGYEKGLSFYRLLETINCQTSYYYQEVFNNDTTILSRERVLFDEDWKRPFSQISLVEFFGSFSRLEEKDCIFPLHYEKFCFEGPTENYVNVATNMTKLVAFRSGQIPDNLADYGNDIFEYYMKNCDLSGLEGSKKEQLAEIIKDKSRQYLSEQEKRVLPLSYVCIKSMEFIKDKKLANDVSFERVQELVIESCKLSEYELNYFPKTIEHILYLQLRDISGLKYIGENTLYGKSIEIKHLKTLSIIDCSDLVSIDLKCDILENLELRNNRSLETINVFSLNLRNIYLFNNPNVNFENIGVYIIKGINVLICKSSCHGDLMKVYAQDYETYVSYVMRYMMVKFFENSDSRYFIMLTLLKMREVDENLFTMGGITNFKGISTIFKNFSTEFEDRALIELLRVYISNIHQRKISIGDLVQSGSMTISSLTIQRIIRLINEALTKSSTKRIMEIKFENTKFFFTSINSAHIKTMADRLKLDKNLVVSFENLKEEAQGEDEEAKSILKREIETIRYIAVEKPEIEKLTLVFRKSCIKYSFLDRIFQSTQSLDQMAREEGSGIRQARSGISYRQSSKESSCNHMKIYNLHLEDCTVPDDRIIDLCTLGNQLKVVESHLSGQIDVISSSEIKMEEICKPQVRFSSVKYLKMDNCILDSFQLIQSMPYLTGLSLHKCQVKASFRKMSGDKTSSMETKKSFSLAAYERLFQILGKLELQMLDLQGFFTCSNSIPEWSQIFDNFCSVLKKMRKLKKLKLNRNYFTLGNLKKLDSTLNLTAIQEIQMNQLGLPFDNLGVIKTELEMQQQKSLSLFLHLFENCKSLKSLSIELNSKQIIQQFVIAISKNESLIELKLNTMCELPSKMLQPLNKNKSLTFISSNVQLPVWLLKHAIENGRRAIAKAQSTEEEQETNRQEEALNTTLTLGSMNSLKSGADFYRLGLSLDGGGVRGMLLATELNYLATRVGYPLHKIFDCIGGTSIGGILALASAGTLDGENPIANSEQLMNIFTKYGRDIFKKTQIMQLKNLFDTKYSASSFEGVLKNYFKDSRLSNCLPETNVIVTAVNRVDNKDYIFRSSEALLNRDRDFYMRDVARATSAAPTYFPSAEIKNVNASVKLSLVDGGVGMNNPSKLVIDEVKKISTNTGLSDNYFLLSLGTGKLPSEVIPEFAGLKDLSPIIDSFTESTAYFVERDLATNYKGHFFRVSPTINVKIKKDAELDNTSESIIEMYKSTGLEAAKKYFENTVIFGKYRNMNLVEWLRENTARKIEY